MMRYIGAGILLAFVAVRADASWLTIQNFSAVQAQQKGEEWCWAAALQISAAAQRVELTQPQIVEMTQRLQPGATYNDITTFLRSGWHGSVGDPRAWTVDSISFEVVPPDFLILRSFQIARPVILAFRTGSNTAHAVVAFAGDWVSDQPVAYDPIGLIAPRPNDHFAKLRVFDPADGTTSDQDWADFRLTIIGVWVPVVDRRDGCNTFGPGVVHPSTCNPPVGGAQVF